MKQDRRKKRSAGGERSQRRSLPALFLLLILLTALAGGCQASETAQTLPAVGPALSGAHKRAEVPAADPGLPAVGPRLGSMASSESSVAPTVPETTLKETEPAATQPPQSTPAETTPSESLPEETLPTAPPETEAPTEPAVTEEPTQEQTQPTAPPETEAPTEEPTEPSTAPTATTVPLPAGSGKDIWIGDSRFVSLSLFFPSDHKEDIIIAENGKSFAWFSETAVPQLREYLTWNPAKHVFIGMGINDCASTYRYSSRTKAADYAAVINDLIAQYPGVTFYFCSVGPGDGTSYGSVNIPGLNRECQRFNDEMKAQCRAVYIDCGEYLQREGFTTVDGIHYDSATYRRWMNYVLSCVE